MVDVDIVPGDAAQLRCGHVSSVRTLIRSNLVRERNYYRFPKLRYYLAAIIRTPFQRLYSSSIVVVLPHQS